VVGVIVDDGVLDGEVAGVDGSSPVVEGAVAGAVGIWIL